MTPELALAANVRGTADSVMKYVIEGGVGVMVAIGGAIAVAAGGATWLVMLVAGVVGGVSIVAIEVIAARRR